MRINARVHHDVFIIEPKERITIETEAHRATKETVPSVSHLAAISNPAGRFGTDTLLGRALTDPAAKQAIGPAH